MRISINNIWLTNDGVADLLAWTDAHDVQLNGSRVVQDAQFLRAVSAQPLARGGQVNELRFAVTRQHSSVAAASAHVLTAFASFPASGTVTIVCGALGEAAVTCTFTAVLAQMPTSSFFGTRTDTTFVLRGGALSALGALDETVIDGGSFDSVYDYPQGGTVDGGNVADALVPATLDVDGGGLG